MIVIGIDPHKSTHTATALDPASHTELGSLRIDATTDGYTRLSNWAAQWPQHTWAVENASGLGRHLSQWLLAQHAVVVDVPATATARVRELSGSRRKNDRLDAAAAAGIAAAQGHSHPVDPRRTDHGAGLARRTPHQPHRSSHPHREPTARVAP